MKHQSFVKSKKTQRERERVKRIGTYIIRTISGSDQEFQLSCKLNSQLNFSKTLEKNSLLKLLMIQRNEIKKVKTKVKHSNEWFVFA
jgi:hypothetical protein